MHSHDINVDSERVSMCHWNVGLTKTNNFNMENLIFKVECNKFICTITVALLNTCRNE